MPFTTNLTGVTQVDDSLVTAFEQLVWLEFGQANVTDALIAKKVEINAKSIQMPKYSRLAKATTPLVETDDITSTALADTKVTFTPVEYGNAITLTSLASFQTGGLVDAAAAQLIGINWGDTMDQIAINAMDASTNEYVIGGTAAGSVTSGQVASRVFLNYFYNKLNRKSVPKIGGSFVMVAHDDVIADLRVDTAVGSFVEVTKYTNAMAALMNEVGMFGGFRIVTDNNCPFADQTGAGTVDLYNSYFLGANALGKATSLPGQMGITGPFDKANRFYNLYWKEVSHTQILDQDAIWKGSCASSVGANAA